MTDSEIFGVVFTAREQAELKPVDSQTKTPGPDEVAGPTEMAG